MKKMISIICLLSMSLTANAATIEDAMNLINGTTSANYQRDNRTIDEKLAAGRQFAAEAADMVILGMGKSDCTEKKITLFRAAFKTGEAVRLAKLAQNDEEFSNNPSKSFDDVTDAQIDIKSYVNFREAIKGKIESLICN